MNKLLSFVLIGGLLMGFAGIASAADIKVKGTFDFGFGLYDTGFKKHDDAENFDALQRFRTQIDIIASDSLKGVAYFEIGNTYWGAGGGSSWGGPGAGRGTGGAIGADGVAVEVKNIYIDWLVPNTPLNVRMGIQPLSLPRAVKRADGQEGHFIVDDDMAGIMLSYSLNESFGINLAWFRSVDSSLGSSAINPATRYGDHDKMDVFAITLPFEMKDTFSFTPYAVYGLAGDNKGLSQNAPDPATLLGGTINALTNGAGLGANGVAMWTGFAVDLTYLDPFVAAVDFAYGHYSSEDVYDLATSSDVETDRSGWTVIAKLGYKLDYFTPVAFGWYASGADDYDKDGRDGLMPIFSPDWGLTSFGWANAHDLAREDQIAASPIGTWAIGLGLEDIKYLENLTSQLRVAYFRGTNDMNINRGNVANRTFTETGLLDTGDSGVEVNFDNVISLYNNLNMYVEFGYIHLSLENEPDNFNSNAWKSYVGFQYAF